jgi:hypothetical protein
MIIVSFCSSDFVIFSLIEPEFVAEKIKESDAYFVEENLSENDCSFVKKPLSDGRNSCVEALLLTEYFAVSDSDDVDEKH